MKKVPIDHDGKLQAIAINAPEGIGVGCTKKAVQFLQMKLVGWRHLFTIKLPICSDCKQLESERESLLSRDMATAKAASNRVIVRSAVLGGILAILAIGFGLLAGFGWWAALSGAVVAGLSLLVGERMGKAAFRMAYAKSTGDSHPRWSTEHPQLPDPTRQAVYVGEIYYGPMGWRWPEERELTRFQRFVTALLRILRLAAPPVEATPYPVRFHVTAICCQCDEYAELLLQRPPHSALQEMIAGEVPAACVFNPIETKLNPNHAPKNLIGHYSSLIADAANLIGHPIDAYLDRATELDFHGEYGKALADYNIALANLKKRSGHPDRWRLSSVYFNRALIYQLLEDEQKADADYQRAISLAPELKRLDNFHGVYRLVVHS